MRALRLHQHGQALQLDSVDVPTPAHGELLVRLETCGICHTDVHIRQGDEAVADELKPITLGHEGIGIVEAVGADVRDYKIGDRVGAPWLHEACLQCRECIDGEEAICATPKAHGVQANGAFADYIILKEKFAIAIPDGMDPLQTAPILCAGATAYTAVLKAELQANDVVAIFGCGGLGLYAIQYALLSGATVIAIDKDPGKLDAATAVGAHKVLQSDARTGAALEAYGGASACINFAPSAGIWPAVEQGLRTRGRFIGVSLPAEPVPLSLSWLAYKNPIVSGASVGNRREVREALRLAKKHSFSIPIERVSIDQIDTVLDRLAGLGEPLEGRAVVDLTV